MPKGDKNRKLSDEQRQQVVEIYTTRDSNSFWVGVRAIAKQFGVRHFVIQRILKNAGVRMRTRKESWENRPVGWHGDPAYQPKPPSTRPFGRRPIKNIPVSDAPLCACGCNELTAWNRRKNRWNKFVEGHYRKDQPYKNRDWLYEQYVTLQRTIDEIAADCGVAGTSVKNFMRRFGIEARDSVAAHVGRQSGEANPAWKGGVTPERQRLYKTQTWKETVKAIFARDRYTCARCNRTRGDFRLHAHHIKSWADYPELRFELSNLITLCEDCHTWVHSRDNANGDFLG